MTQQVSSIPVGILGTSRAMVDVNVAEIDNRNSKGMQEVSSVPAGILGTSCTSGGCKCT